MSELIGQPAQTFGHLSQVNWTNGDDDDDDGDGDDDDEDEDDDDDDADDHNGDV